MTRLVITFAVLCSVLVSKHSIATDATTEAEKRYLIQVVKELHLISELVAKAEEKRDPAARIKLNYGALQRDVEEMRRALEEHITAPSRSPRAIQTLEIKPTR